MYRRATLLLIALLCVTLAPVTTYADEPTLESTPVSPSNSVDPDTFVTFSVIPRGFAYGIQYAVQDSSGVEGATTAVVDTSGIFTWRPTTDDAGPHLFTIVAIDAYGTTASVSVPLFVTGSYFSISNPSPGLTLVPGRTLSFQMFAIGYSSPTYAVYDSSYGSSVSAGNISGSSFSWTPTLNDVGDHQLRVLASDVYGHTDSIYLLIRVVNPVVLIGGITNHTLTTAETATFTASVPLFATTTFSVSDDFTSTSTLTTSAINSTTGRFSWKPSLADVGSHFLTVTATDALGNVASGTTHYWVVAAPATSTLAPAVPSIPLARAPTEATSTSLTSQYRFTKNLAVGARGQAVSELQKRLKSLGYYTGPITGYYGPLTAGAVKKLQGGNRIPTIGVVGPTTRAFLNSLK